MQPDGDIESQNTTPRQTHVNPDQISNNVKHGLNLGEIKFTHNLNLDLMK